MVGSISRRVDIQVAAYDGKELTGEASVAGNGTLKVEIAATDGTDPLSSESRPVTAAKTIDLRQEFAGKPGLIVRLRLAEAPSGTVSFTEIRVDKLPTASPPPPPPTPQTFEAGAQAAARRWVRALSVNDADVAWELLAADSRKTVGGRAGFDARFTELAGGWGAWDGAPDTSYRVVSLIDEGGKANLSADLPRLGVVVLSGRVAQEGATSFRTMSLPVRGTLDKIQIDPFTDINIELDKADGAGVGPRTVLGAYAPAGARVWFVLDGATPVGPDASEGADGDQQHATFTPALSPGRHSFTVVVLRVDGRVASRSATYTVT